MIGQTPLPCASLPLQVETEQAIAPVRSTRFLWAGLGFAVVMLTGVSACLLLPIAKPSRLIPELAFIPGVPLLHPGSARAHSASLRPAALPGVAAVRPRPISALRMTEKQEEEQGAGTMSIAQALEVAKKLTPLQRAIAFSETTEKPFTGETTNGYAQDNMEKGTYVGAISGATLFESDAKYDAETGWPSFTAPVAGSVIERLDPCDLSMAGRAEPPLSQTFGCDVPEETPKGDPKTDGLIRQEVIDAVSGAHLGHVFNDGPKGGKRYSMNAGAMTFVPA